jgi:hypothetical protein
VLREDQVVVEGNAKPTYCLTISDVDGAADMTYSQRGEEGNGSVGRELGGVYIIVAAI